MDKRIDFLIKVDSSEFDRAVEQMQRKLKDIYRPADILAGQRQTAQRLEGLGLGGGMSKPAMDAVLKSIGTARMEMGKVIKEQQVLQNESLKSIQSYIAREKELLTLKAAGKKTAQEELDLEVRLQAAQKNRHNEEIQYRAREKTIMQAAQAHQGMGEDIATNMAAGLGGGRGGGGGGIPGGAAGAGLVGGLAKLIPSLLKGGAIASVIGAIANEAERYSSIPSQVKQAQGSTAQGLFGTPLGSMAQGQLPEDLLYKEQTSSAQQSSQVAEMGRRFSDVIFGQILPVGMAKAIFGGSDRQSEAFLKDLPLGQAFRERHTERYESMQAQQTQEDMLATRKAAEMTDPLRKQGLDDFQQNFMTNLQFQRATGLNYDTFHGPGGFKEQMSDAGFTPEMGMESSQGILGAGGSTRMAQGGAGLSLQAQRGFGMTNANQNLGQLSGLMGDTASTRQAYVRLLAEGTKLGFDDTNYRQEFRQFVDIQTKAVTTSGTRSQTDIDMIASRIGGFLGGDKTARGLNAGQGAYQAYSTAVSSTKGPQGAMRAGAFLSDPVLGKLGGRDQAKLFGVDLDHLTTDHPVVQDIYNRNKDMFKGMSEEEAKQKIVDSAVGAGAKSFFQGPQGDMGAKKQQDIKKQLANTKDPRKRKQLERQLMAAIDATASEIGMQTGIQDPVELRQMARGIGSGGAARGQALKEMQAAESKLGDKGGGVFEDKQVQALAEQSKLMIHAFQRLHSTFVPLTGEVSKYTTELERQAIAYGNLGSDKARADWLKNPGNKGILADYLAHQPKKQDQKQ